MLNLRGRSIQYNILQREVDTNRSLYDALLQRYKEIGVAGGIGTAPVSIVDRADAPAVPYKPNLLLNLLAGPWRSACLPGSARAVGLEFINDTIKTREDVRNKLGLACLGAVPKTTAQGHVHRGTEESRLDRVGSLFGGRCGAAIQHRRRACPRSLLVTSTRSGEGKSSTALALAQNFARREKSVLLIDSDLRKPAFKAAIGQDRPDQAADQRGSSRPSHVVETQHANLWLLPSGPLPPNPADLLSTGRFRKIIAEAAEQFDIVIIDASADARPGRCAAARRGRRQCDVRRSKAARPGPARRSRRSTGSKRPARTSSARR